MFSPSCTFNASILIFIHKRHPHAPKQFSEITISSGGVQRRRQRVQNSSQAWLGAAVAEVEVVVVVVAAVEGSW